MKSQKCDSVKRYYNVCEDVMCGIRFRSLTEKAAQLGSVKRDRKENCHGYTDNNFAADQIGWDQSLFADSMNMKCIVSTKDSYQI